jgi:hypothetical protein
LGYGEHYRVRSPRGRFFYSRIDDALRRREAGRDDGCRIGRPDGLRGRRGRLTRIIIIIETTGSATA